MKDSCAQYKVVGTFGSKNARWQYLLQDFPFDSIAQAGKAIGDENWISAKARLSGESLATQFKEMKDSSALGRIVPQFTTLSRDDELSAGNQSAICRIFKKAVEDYDWKCFETGTNLANAILSLGIFTTRQAVIPPLVRRTKYSPYSKAAVQLRR